MKIVTVYGSPTPPGRLAKVLEAAQQHALKQNKRCEVQHISPSFDETKTFLFWNSEALNLIENADALIIASPVFRASIPAILKELLDCLPVRALRSKPVGLLVVGNVAEHYLGVERHMSDILAWFGALYVPATCYLTAPLLSEGIPEDYKEQIEQLVESTLLLAEQLDGKKLGPVPLAELHGR